MVDNFNWQVQLEDGMLYIYNEDGAGAEYPINDVDDIPNCIKRYIEYYC